MMTATKFCLSWCYREGERSVRRSLHSYHAEPCIEAARVIRGNPYTFDIEVVETDTGKSVDWAAPGIGKVLVAGG